MRGTEKQIAWATEIQSNIVKTLENAIDLMGKVNAPEDIRRKNIEDTSAWMDAIQNADYAGDIIDLFKDIRFSGNLDSDFRALMAKRRITPSSCPAYKALLHK